MMSLENEILQPISLRPAGPDDIDFLYSLHVATMRPYVDKTWGWNDEIQEKMFRENYAPDKIQIIIFAGENVGMISWEDRGEDVFLRVIEIYPSYQQQGLGTKIIRQIIAEAERQLKPVFLRVLKVNPAKRLYERLGFSVVEETATHFHMRTSLSDR